MSQTRLGQAWKEKEAEGRPCCFTMKPISVEEVTNVTLRRVSAGFHAFRPKLWMGSRVGNLSWSGDATWAVGLSGRYMRSIPAASRSNYPKLSRMTL